MYAHFRNWQDDEGTLFGPADSFGVQHNFIVGLTSNRQANIAQYDTEKQVWRLLSDRSDSSGFKYVTFLDTLPARKAKPIPAR